MSKKLSISMLRTIFPGKTLVAALGLTALVYGAKATPVTVQEVGVGPNEVVQMTSSTLGTAWVYAGIIDLKVNGTPTDGFCIDPFHWSAPGVLNYQTETLGNAPKPPGPMGAATALKIEQLWQQYFSPTMSNPNAAGLQIAIWELVGGSNFKLDSANDYGASTMLDWVDKNPDAVAANLIAVTGPGQDYVIQNKCPDGAETIALLSMSLAGLATMRSKMSAVRSSKKS
jgi:hypothetical protein